jgi:hypothetical protein
MSKKQCQRDVAKFFVRPTEYGAVECSDRTYSALQFFALYIPCYAGFDAHAPVAPIATFFVWPKIQQVGWVEAANPLARLRRITRPKPNAKNSNS